MNKIMKVKYIAVILLSTQLVYTACDDMGFLQIKPDSLELTDDRIKTVDDLENLLLGAYNGIQMCIRDRYMLLIFHG